MSTRNRITLATLALLASSTVVLAAYADDNNKNTDTKHPVAAQANQENTNQPNSTQPNANRQPSTTQPPYRVNMNPGVLERGQIGQSGRQNVDLFLIPCLINANNGEVALGNVVAQRGQSSEVKDFAQEMVKDHSAAAKEFEQLQTKLTGAMHPQSSNNTPVAAALFQINQEIEQTCLANAQRELEQQSGADFDRCYIGMQVGMHMHMVSVLSVLKNHATSPDLEKAIEDASQVTARHLEHAKKIVKQLEQPATNASTR